MASRGQGAAGGRGNRERDDRGNRPMVDPDPIREPVEETFEEGELAPIIMGQPTSPSTRGQEGAGGRGNRDRDDRGKRPMVVPDPICEPVEETLEKGELAPIIIGQPTAPSTQVEAGERSSAGQRSSVGQKKKKKKKKNGRREIAPALPQFDIAVKTRLEVWAESVPYKLMDEYKIWIKTKVFKDWSDASFERMGASHIAGRFATDEGKAWLVKKIEMWERWLNASKPRQVKLGSFSWKMKGCEPISDNQLRWITLKTQISDLTRKIGQGSYGSVYLVGFRDVALGLELGMEGVVPYVAKKCDEKPPYSAWVMMHKELASFAETHCAIVQPIACHNIEAEPILVVSLLERPRHPSVEELGAHHKRN
ncbi:hypothetical protein R1sor_003402 [Riccia sorocarpa]|uniref:Uncharacterized protein n=1 Tax=Riccia sorocarpa TaxID=122646 RepID=A0ABD3H1I2_9MARC